MASSYGVSYILAAGQALFTKYNLLREEARQAKTAFNDNLDTWTEASQVVELTNTFGTTDVTNFKAVFYDSEDELKAAMTTAVASEDYFTEKMKLLINKWREAAFQPGKDDGAAHKEQLRAILYALEITKLLSTGSTQQNIGNWLKMPWLMPVEYSETLALGLRTAGAAKLHIGEADSRIKHHLDTAQKAFASVEAMCEHMRVCALVAIVKDGAQGTG
eukprot:1690701-Rhodomonas_salina.1